jgi:acetyltransferase-like isoleucine patch superfamily enzyme
MLPFKQAIKLPILLYKPRFYNTKSKIIINSKNIYPGMILLGTKGASYDDHSTGVRMNLYKGGKIIFNGTCRIGCNSIIEVGKNGILHIGNGFAASSTLRLYCFCNIHIENDVHMGWDQLIMDTNWHALKDFISGKKYTSSKPIFIGNNNWFGSRCVILPGVRTSNFSTFGLGCILSKNTESTDYTLHTSDTKIIAKRNNVFRDYNDDKDPLI